MAVPQLQLANLGEIYAQNQAKQAAMDTMQLEQASAVEKMRQEQLARQKQSQLMDLARTVDISKPEGAKQAFELGLMDLPTYTGVQKSATDMALAQQRTKTAQIQGETSQGRLAVEQRKADIYERKSYADIRNQAAQLGISAKNAETARLESLREYGRDRTELLGQSAFNLMQQPKEQRPALYQIFRQQAIKSGQFTPEDLPEQYDEAIVAGTALWFKPQKQGTTVNINQGGGSYFKEVGKGFAQQDLTAIESAKKSPEQIETAQSVIDIINQGKAITGTGADLRANIAKSFATIGLISGESVAATEQLSSKLARQTMDSIKSSGLGAGQGFTNTDREFLEKAASGKISFTPEGLMRIAELNKKVAEAAYQKGQEAINRIKQNPEGASIIGGYQLPELPTVTQPAPANGGQGGNRVRFDAEGNPVQ